MLIEVLSGKASAKSRPHLSCPRLVNLCATIGCLASTFETARRGPHDDSYIQKVAVRPLHIPFGFLMALENPHNG